MKELVIIAGVCLIANMLAFVLSGGPKPAWQIEKERYDREMNEIVARQPGGLLSHLEAR